MNSNDGILYIKWLLKMLSASNGKLDVISSQIRNMLLKDANFKLVKYTFVLFNSDESERSSLYLCCHHVLAFTEVVVFFSMWLDSVNILWRFCKTVWKFKVDEK